MDSNSKNDNNLFSNYNFFLKSLIHLFYVESHGQQVASDPNLGSKTNRLRKKMNSSTVSNNRSFLNTPLMLNGVRFKVWKYRFKICIQSIGIELWKTIIDDSFIPNHQINGEVKDKFDFL